MARKSAAWLTVFAGVGLAAFVVWRLAGGTDGGRARKKGGPAPVEVAPVEAGPIEWRRGLSGTLEARERFVVATHVAGRVRKLEVDLADPVTRGQVVAELDDEEPGQAVAQSRAELAVAEARQDEANDALSISEREYERLKKAEQGGLASTSELDQMKGDYTRKRAAVAVAVAQKKRATADLRLARIRSGYTKVVAAWTGTDKERVVARRHVTVGDLVTANTPLFTVIALEPLMAVVFITEKEYRYVQREQLVTVTTDAYPERTFSGRVVRIAPMFEETSRQARVEIEVKNADGILKPGMFVRCAVVFQRVENATQVPSDSLVMRDAKTGVFLTGPAGAKAVWTPVELGIDGGDHVEIKSPALTGRVVTLGQQLLDDGSPIKIVRERAASLVGGGS